MNNQDIVIEKVYNYTVQKVWDALTDIEQMKIWYFDLPEFKAEKGFEFQFYGGKEADRQYLHLCKVTHIVPGKLLTYSWKYNGYPGHSLVTFALDPVETGTRLTLTHSGIESFERFNPDFAKESFVKGWTSFLNDSLKDFLDIPDSWDILKQH